MTLGVLAWPLRYIIFVIGGPAWLVIASLSLHGFCYVFFFTAAYIYVDMIAPPGHPGLGPEPDRRHHPRARQVSSAAFSAGWIQKLFTSRRRTRSNINWRNVFLVPTVLTLLCAGLVPGLLQGPRKPRRACGLTQESTLEVIMNRNVSASGSSAADSSPASTSSPGSASGTPTSWASSTLTRSGPAKPAPWRNRSASARPSLRFDHRPWPPIRPSTPSGSAPRTSPGCEVMEEIAHAVLTRERPSSSASPAKSRSAGTSRKPRRC